MYIINNKDWFDLIWFDLTLATEIFQGVYLKTESSDAQL